MTSDLAFTVTRIGFLILLWVLVLGAVATLRRDIFGTVVTPRGKGRKQADQKRRTSRNQARLERRERKSQSTSAPAAIPNNLLITGGPLVGTMLPLGGADVTIGRSPASTLVLEDPYASGAHARLTRSANGWVIEDLGSRNGTFVDDERLVQPLVLRAGTTVRIGQTTLELVQ